MFFKINDSNLYKYPLAILDNLVYEKDPNKFEIATFCDIQMSENFDKMIKNHEIKLI